LIDSNTIESLLPEGPIFEMILVTTDPSGHANAAPVGVTRKGKELAVELAEDTTSAANLLATGNANICLVREPLVFAEAAFDLIGDGAFGEKQLQGIPCISGAAATISACLMSSRRYIKKDELGPTAFLHLTLEPTNVRSNGMPMPHSRRYSAAIEAIIHTTRVQIARRRKLRTAVDEYSLSARKEIQRARRTGTDPATDEALELCLERLGDEGRELNGEG
jgi:hypothetical protein